MSGIVRESAGSHPSIVNPPMFFPRHISILSRRFHAALVVLGMLSGVHAVIAQQHTAPAIGIVGGVESGFIRGHFPIYGGTPGCGEFTSGRSDGSWIGASFSMPLPQMEDIGASFRLGWLQTQDQFTGAATDTLWAYDPALRSDVVVNREFRYSFISRAIALEMLATWRVAGGFNLAVGPRIGYRLVSKAVQSAHLMDANGLIFTGEGEISRMENGEILTSRPFMLGATVAGWYEIPLDDRLRLAAEFSASTNILSTMHQMQWIPFTARAGLGLRVVLNSHRSPIADIDNNPPDTSTPGSAMAFVDTSAGRIIPKESDSAFGLEGSIRIFGVDERGERTAITTVHAIETVRRRKILLDNGIFTVGDAAPNGLLRSSEDADRFSIDSLRDIDAPSIQSHLLNIIGERLRKFPTATIALGTRERNPRTDRLANTIATYLTDIWRIPPDRILITEPLTGTSYKEDLSLEQRASGILWISSETPQIMEPVAFEHTDRDFTAPVLTLEPLYQSDTGIKRWDIVLAHQETVVARYSSLTPEDDRETAFGWQPIFNKLRNDSTALTATFAIEDNRGQKLTVQSQIPLRMRERRRIIENTTRMSDGHEEIRYILPPADTSALDSMNVLLTEIVGSIQGGSTVEIIGIISGNSSSLDTEMGRHAATVIGGIEAAHGRRLNPPAGIALMRLAPAEAGFGESMPEPGSIAVVVRNAGASR